MQYKVLDTNILLLNASNLISLGQDGSTIVIPETTVDEIDSKKSGLTELAFQAREFGRMLTKATRSPVKTDGVLTLVPMQLDGINILIVSSSEYPKFTTNEFNISNDRKIIEIAVQLSKTREVLFISNDVMCCLRAESLGLNAQDLKDVERIDFIFTKDLIVDDMDFRMLHRQDIKGIDVEYKLENYNYRFINKDTSQVKLGYISNGIIELIGKDTEKELRRQDINPVNSGQLFLAKAIQDTTVDMVICEALAGSGKTLTSLSNSIRLVKRGEYESITYVRASVDDVPKEEEVGFLSGNDDKFSVYLHPLEDSLDYIIRNRYKNNKGNKVDMDLKVADGVLELKYECSIVGMTGLGMRGRTFHNSILIIDEVQNMSKASLQKVLTRVGKGCKVILIGSNRQIDNPYLTKFNNGLSTLLTSCTEGQDYIKVHAVPLERVVRGKVAEFAENLFSKK